MDRQHHRLVTGRRWGSCRRRPPTSAAATSPPAWLQCRHLWAPAGLLSLDHLAFYASVPHHLRCLNGFRYQRRCHKLTLAMSVDRLWMLKSAGEVVPAADVEVPYQEPHESYLGKFRRSWAWK